MADTNGEAVNKHKVGNWMACLFILGTECCERLAFYAMSANLVNYLHLRFKHENVTAANHVTNWLGTCYITPLIGAFIADSYLGRFRTIASFLVIYIIGMALLTLISTVPLPNPSCDAKECHLTTAHPAVCFIALYLIALGAGGIKPCVSSLGADQFGEADEAEKEKKSSFFNWFYFVLT